MDNKKIETTITLIQDFVAITALNKIKGLPQRGLPQNQWTVYAAIIAQELDKTGLNSFHVISLGTGSKCVGQRLMREDGSTVHDSHAEVIARRGFVQSLYNELKYHIHHDDSDSSNDNKTSSSSSSNNQQIKFNLLEKDGDSYIANRNLHFHLYISDAPCGDGAIFNAYSACETKQSGVSFSGAKLVNTNIVNNDNNDNRTEEVVLRVPIVREGEQILGQLRTKAGKSTILEENLTLSMSCSDKIAKWTTLGIQGTLLTNWIIRPIFLESIVISRDERATKEDMEKALTRAIPDRVELVKKLISSTKDVDLVIIPLPKILITNYVYEFSKAQTEICFEKILKEEKEKEKEFDKNDSNDQKQDGIKQQDNDPSPPKKKRKKGPKMNGACGFSINWYYQCQNTKGLSIEVLIGSEGRLQGPKKFLESPKSQSRLSKASLFKSFIELVNLTKETKKKNRKSIENTEEVSAFPDKTYREWKQSLKSVSVSRNIFFNDKNFSEWIFCPASFENF